MTEISFHDEYAGHIGAEKVAWFYRAFAEEHQPYVILLDALGEELYITQYPSAATPYDEPGEDPTALDRENAATWVDTLTKLVWKARAYDDMVEQIYGDETTMNLCAYDGFDVTWTPDSAVSVILGGDNPILDGFLDDDIVVDLASPHGFDSAYTVPELTSAEDDQEWVDQDGDHYKVIDDEWHWTPGYTDEWTPVEEDTQFLTDYGPYTAVRGERQPRKVKRLTESERDAEWQYFNYADTEFRYRWNSDLETWEGWYDGRPNDTWSPVDERGPFIGNGDDDFLVEVIA